MNSITILYRLSKKKYRLPIIRPWSYARRNKKKKIDKMSQFFFFEDGKQHVAWIYLRDEKNFCQHFRRQHPTKIFSLISCDIVMVVWELTEFHHTRLLIKRKIFCERRKKRVMRREIFGVIESFILPTSISQDDSVRRRRKF